MPRAMIPLLDEELRAFFFGRKPGQIGHFAISKKPVKEEESRRQAQDVLSAQEHSNTGEVGLSQSEKGSQARDQSVVPRLSSVQPHEGAPAPPPIIGTVGFWPERFDFKNRVGVLALGFFKTDDRGKGYGTEVLQWTLDYGFKELNLHKIELTCSTHNTAGLALYRKA